MTRLVVVGSGMAGSRLAAELRRRDPSVRLRVTVVGEEPHPPYNRVLLSNVLAGKAAADDIRLADGGGVDLRTGVRVTALDRAAKEVALSDGGRLPYDTCVLATGSTAFVPPVAGLVRADGTLLPGAVPFRTLDDCSAILAAADGARRAVVLGGGLLGLEAARGLAGRGLDVEVLHVAGHLMERQLDPRSAGVLARTVRRLGVAVRLGARLTAVAGDGRVEGLVLDDGTTVPADLLVLACGVRPETDLARAAGLAVDRGVLVDDELRSATDPDVRAIGECAQHDGQVYGLVAPAWEQAAVLADLLTGSDPGARYGGSRQVTRLKAAGVQLAAMGDTHAGDDPDDPEVEVLSYADPARDTYKKLVIRDGRLVGAILLGDVATVGQVTQLYDRGAPVPGDRLPLLFAGLRGGPEAVSPTLLPDSATVCHCNGVTKGAITACWLAGSRGVADIAARTRATTGCGTCRDTVCGLVEWLEASDPPAPLPVPETPLEVA